MGYGTRESFRIVGKIFKEKSTSVHRRYYDKLKEIKEKRLVIDDIIEKYHIPNKSYILRHIRLQKQLNKF